MIKILFTTLLSISLWGMSNHDVSQKSDETTSGYKDASSDMYMTLINAKGQKRKRHMKIIMLEKEAGDKSLMTFISPADVKGTKFLNYEHILKDDDQWLYLPALQRVKRIASKSKSGSFMGSEFSFEDLSSFNVNKYSYKGEASIVSLDGKKLYKGERFPITENSGYTKNVFWIDTTTFLLHKVEYYDRKHELLKTAYFSGYTKISGAWRTGQIIMKNHQNDKQTILVWKDEKVNIGLKEKSFHKRVLKKR
ncbi:outer membrane lipoprotein-sorting protein [Sulfurimonas sp. MAG313]|nr:outer membrane lipoprotein-sorting protein [Sulfurimonas sp. MAG313]MDF1879879.1 outer membrane lipoprotein-sorting protein [Sulfurimonas sp. MAG313]